MEGWFLEPGTVSIDDFAAQSFIGQGAYWKHLLSWWSRREDDDVLLMAFELGKINEATETFKVLSSMAGGLVLAFQTTLVALLAYLPLRKATDYLLQRLTELEDVWKGWRTERAESR